MNHGEGLAFCPCVCGLGCGSGCSAWLVPICLGCTTAVGRGCPGIPDHSHHHQWESGSSAAQETDAEGWESTSASDERVQRPMVGGGDAQRAGEGGDSQERSDAL